MIISDLDYLAAANENLVGGTGNGFKKNLDVNVDTNIDFNYDSDIDAKFDKDIYLDSDLKLDGNFASFAFDNEAVGPYTVAEGEMTQISIYGKYSGQSGLFVAGADY